MDSPLKGTGIPPLDTTAIYVSAYLDRLLAVNQDDYRWEGALYFYISWTSADAYRLVMENTKKMFSNSSFTCQFMCSNIVDKMLCCDDIYLPSFFFKNAYGFPQDREILYNIYTASNGSVLWEVRVHGQYYQPMDFRHFPFDSFDLLLELRFFNPLAIIDTTDLYGKPHPGVTIYPSSGGQKLFTYGRGDDASYWAVTDFSLEGYEVDMGEWFYDNSALASNPGDPMPLAPVNDNWTAGAVDRDGNPANVYSGVTDQLLAVLITIERFWKPSLINSVLPVVLVFLLGMFIFVCEEDDLTTRIEIVVTLFLALTAVQFVLIGSVPTSSYVVPTQQLVLATYVFLFLLAVESIIVYRIVMHHQKRQRALRRREAYRRYCKLRDRGKLKGGNNPPLSAADTITPAASRDATFDAAECAENGEASKGAAAAAADALQDAAAEQAAAQAEAMAAGATPGKRPRRQRWQETFSLCFRGPHEKAQQGSRQPPSRFVSFSHMTADEAYAEWLGHMVDNVFGCVMGLSYVILAILIFTLQHGYIDLFSD
ncbi:hypothetical protein ABPG75_008673 [Micractinium tetrahymenae]